MTSIRSVVALHPQSKIYSTGANQPMDIRCEDVKTSERLDVVVKFMGAERMAAEGASFELIGNLFAQVWDLWVPEPVLVNISNSFVETMRGHELFSIAEKSIGLNFGTIKELDLDEPGPNCANEVELQEMQQIFAFDQFIDNADRSKLKPNCMIKNGKIMIFDHELCFSFTRMLLSNGYFPWTRSSHQINYELKKSYFFEQILGHPVDQNTIMNRLERFDRNRLNSIFQAIPTEFHNDKLDNIFQSIENVVNNRGSFVAHLKQLME